LEIKFYLRGWGEMSIFAKNKLMETNNKEKNKEKFNANRSEENARNFICFKIAFMGNE
jgi:hypothetical protein